MVCVFTEQIRVVSDALLSNALKCLANGGSLLIKIVVQGHSEQKCYLEVRNTTSIELGEAQTLASDLSDPQIRDSIGVTTVHLASQVCEYDPPVWRACEDSDYVVLEARVQIGVLANDGESR